MKFNNKGMSLIEIIVAVALISILIGAVGYSLTFSKSKDVEQCAKEMASAIQHCRTITMGKNDTTITISYEDNKVVATETMKSVDNTGVESVTINKKVIGKVGLDVTYSTSGGDKSLASEQLTLKFNRGNGSLQATNGTEGMSCTQIVISRGADSKTIEIVPVTGRVSLLD